MNYKLVLVLWAVFAASIIYWDINKWDDKTPVSVCHQAEVKVYKDKYLCTKCEEWCEVKK